MLVRHFSFHPNNSVKALKGYHAQCNNLTFVECIKFGQINRPLRAWSRADESVLTLSNNLQFSTIFSYSINSLSSKNSKPSKTDILYKKTVYCLPTAKSNPSVQSWKKDRKRFRIDSYRSVAWELSPLWRFEPARVKPN